MENSKFTMSYVVQNENRHVVRASSNTKCHQILYFHQHQSSNVHRPLSTSKLSNVKRRTQSNKIQRLEHVTFENNSKFEEGWKDAFLFQILHDFSQGMTKCYKHYLRCQRFIKYSDSCRAVLYPSLYIFHTIFFLLNYFKLENAKNDFVIFNILYGTI